MSLPVDDLILPFQLQDSTLRGRLVRLGPAIDAVMRQHDYPEPVAGLLAEALACAAALAGALKYEGVFTLQAQGDGPVTLVVADVTSAGAMRGYARFNAEHFATAANHPSDSLTRLLGAGYLAFTVDQGADCDRYQGIVELAGATLAECAHEYFRQSEQLETAVMLAAGRVGDSWRAAALTIQRMPGREEHDIEADEDDEDWRRAVVLMSSAKNTELLSPELAPALLLHRLFHAEGLTLLPTSGLEARCRCSVERVEGTLRSFPREDIQGMMVEGKIAVTCEFCKTEYAFAPADLDRLYA